MCGGDEACCQITFNYLLNFGTLGPHTTRCCHSCSSAECRQLLLEVTHFYPNKAEVTCILPIFLYVSECWAVTKVNACRIDALDQCCLITLFGIKWHQFVRNEELRRISKQPNLTAIIQSIHFSLFGHIAHMDMMQMLR